MNNLTVFAIAVVLIGLVIACVYYLVNDPNAQRNQRKKQFVLGAKSSELQISGKKQEMLKRQQLQERLRKIEEKNKKNKKVNRSLEFRLGQAGMVMHVMLYRLVFVTVALVLGMLSYTVTKSIYIAPVLFVIVGLYFPFAYINRKIDRRQRAFVELFPQGLDIIVRGVRSGLPISDCIKVVGNEIDEPVGTEFKILADQLSIGLSMDDALQRFCSRMPLKEVNFLRIVLLIQRQSGGNLSEVLRNLADMIRGRKKLKNKVKALSAEAKTGAIIIGSLPGIVMAAIYMLNPEYIAVLFEDRRGHIALIGAAVWMTIGVLVMRKMMDFKV